MYYNSFSQIECGTIPTSSFVSNPSRGSSCGSSGSDYIEQYRTPKYWIPNSSTPIKTILVNIIVCQDDSGGNGWQDTPQWRADIADLYLNVNNVYSNSQPKGYASTCEPVINFIADTRIRFEINDIIFIKNTAFNIACAGQTSKTDAIDDYVRANYPNSKKAMNQIFTSGVSCPYFGIYQPHGKYSYVLINAMWDHNYINHPDYFGCLCHEYGHALGLFHTFNGEITKINDFDFLDDVFGCGPEPLICSVPCTAPAGYICYLSKCFFSNPTGNPLMCSKGTPTGSLTSPNTYISPKSAGRFHRALSLFDKIFVSIDDRPMYQYVKEKYSYPIPKEIKSSESWDFAIQLYQDIVVKTGNTLTIKCEVRMPKDGKIIVEQGAKLIIDGGIITCAWDEGMWQGIEVWGDRTKTQTTANQGYLIMQNGAIIENAKVGVTLQKQGEGWWFNGGVIQATNSTFKNNRFCVGFMSYHRPTGLDINLSYLKNCTFVCDAPLKDPIYTDSDGRRLGTKDFVSLWDVSRVNFLGNTFINAGTFDADIRGKAFISVEASYNIEPLVSGTTIDKNEFINLTDGVQSLTLVGSAVKNVRVINSVFDNVYHGITGNIVFSSITGNTFNNIPAGQLGLDAWGIYMDGAKGFTISGNNVFNSSASNNYGVIVKYSAGFGGTVKDNTFNGLAFGTQTEQNNPLLSISCNAYNNNQKAWSINPLSTSSTFANQGTGCIASTQVRAGNLFSGNTCDIKSYLIANWKYYGWGSPTATIPQCVTGNVTLNNCIGTGSDPTTCVQTPPCGSPPCAMALEQTMLKEKEIIRHLQMLNELISYYSSTGDDQKIIHLLEQDNTIDTKKILVPTYIDKKDFVKAQNTLNQIPYNNAENTKYKDYFQVLINLGTSERRVQQINPSEELIIRDVAASNTEASSNAQIFLEFVRAEQIIRIPEKEISTRMANATIVSEQLKIEEQPFLSDNYPNPYADYTTITATVPSKSMESYIEVFNLIGERLQTFKLHTGENTISIKKSEIGKGLFFYSLIIDGKKAITKRMLTIE